MLSVVDIDVLKRALGAAEWARDYAKATVEAVQVPLVVFDEKFEIVSANAAFEERYGVPREAVAGQSIHDVLGGVLDTPALRSALERLRERNESFQRLELECELPRLGTRVLSLSGRSVPHARQRAADPAGRRRHHRASARRGGASAPAPRDGAAKASAEDANRTKDLFLATLSHELRTPLSSLLLSAQLLRKGKMDEAKLRKTAESHRASHQGAGAAHR